MAMASRSLLLIITGLIARGVGAEGAGAEALNFGKAGSSIHAHRSALRSQMQSMMADGEDDVDFHMLGRRGEDTSRRGQLQASGPSAGTASMDDYIKEAEDGLSAALGPRWSARALEEDANRKTSALLRGISGP
eukprot:CAMPEP_0175216646 /NCGR_PEP_ID=MMETSP0093-20121207/17836_1 /TAXON_ID=311494 /ORGANISM="Alexandrium monilatum, Strain CCMP3105" /LENGTH=133 /DNA_ID=CAMNT_0016510049 /DNA_START=118 /DNA_END=515 /DNA_ORIENTATION=+